jgi:hypothetical protein
MRGGSRPAVGALPRPEWVTKACRQPQLTSRPHSRSVSGRTCLVHEIKVEVGKIFSIEESERPPQHARLKAKPTED